MNFNVAVIKGDGIGPEIVDQAVRVLDAVAEKSGHQFTYEQILMGGASIDAYGKPLTDETLEIAGKSDAVLMGSIGEILPHPHGISCLPSSDRKQDFLL